MSKFSRFTAEQLAVPLDYFEREVVPTYMLTDAQLQISAIDNTNPQLFRVGSCDSPEALNALAKHVSDKMGQPFNTILLNAKRSDTDSTIYNYSPRRLTAQGPKYIGKVVELALLGHPVLSAHNADNTTRDPFMMNTGSAIGLSAVVRHRIFYSGRSKYLRTMFLGYDVTKSAL